MKKILNFINGEMLEPVGKKYLENFNPSRGIAYSLIPDSTEADVDLAIEAAKKAQPRWAGLTAEQRGHYLRELANGITRKLELFAQAESVDNGKPVTLAKSIDIPRSARNFEFFADAITQFHGESYRSNVATLNYTDYSPLGVVACISPWNLPLYLLTWKIAPALAAGNTVVAKPSELTPMTAYLLCQVADEIGLPKGVLNIVHGTGAAVGAPLVAHPEVKAVSFTGSTLTGQNIAKATASQFKKLSLEMGGKNPNIIFADCDFEKALETTLQSSFANQGQICLCGSRIFVEKTIYEKFKAELVAKTKLLRQGDPLLKETEQGALVSQAHMEKVLSYIALGQQQGATLLTGGQRLTQGALAKGAFVQPTVFTDCRDDMAIVREEIFGPVMSVLDFNDEAEVVARANATDLGLAAGIFTNDLTRAHRVIAALEAGTCWINTYNITPIELPFGGTKQSGLGRENGKAAIEYFTQLKSVYVAMEPIDAPY